MNSEVIMEYASQTDVQTYIYPYGRGVWLLMNCKCRSEGLESREMGMELIKVSFKGKAAL